MNEMQYNEFSHKCINSNLFNTNQIVQINQGFEYGLTTEQIKLYVGYNFYWQQMYEIIQRLLTTMDVKEIISYVMLMTFTKQEERLCLND